MYKVTTLTCVCQRQTQDSASYTQDFSQGNKIFKRLFLFEKQTPSFLPILQIYCLQNQTNQSQVVKNW